MQQPTPEAFDSFPEPMDLADALADPEDSPPAVDVVVTNTVRVELSEARSFTVGRQSVPPFTGSGVGQLNVAEVAQHHPARTLLVLVNTGSGLVYIGDSRENTTPSTGFPLPAGASLDIPTSDAVYATSAQAGVAGELAMLQTFRQG